MDLPDAIREVQQPRTRYQLERFVVGQFEHPAMQFRQAVLEIQDVTYKLEHARLELRKAEIEVERLRATGDPVDAVDADLRELGTQQTRLAMLGAEQELADLHAIYEDIPHYTRDEIEAAQAEHYRLKLTGEVRAQLESGGVNWAHLMSLHQAGELHAFRAQLEGEAATAALPSAAV